MKPLDERAPKTGERFLSRWSRLKRGSRGEAPPVEGVANPAEGTTAATGRTATGALASSSVPSPTPPATAGARRDTLSSRAGAQPAGTPQDDVVAALPAIDSLTVDSDYAPFFQPKVPEALRRAAVKKLFADPHFNVMDGLDTYIDDYTKPDPIPESMLRSLNHAQGFFAPVADPVAAHEAASAVGAAAATDDARPASPASDASQGEPSAAGTGEISAANPSAVATVTDSTAPIADPTVSDAANGAADATQPNVAASNTGVRNEAPDPLD